MYSTPPPAPPGTLTPSPVRAPAPSLAPHSAPLVPGLTSIPAPVPGVTPITVYTPAPHHNAAATSGPGAPVPVSSYTPVGAQTPVSYPAPLAQAPGSYVTPPPMMPYSVPPPGAMPHVPYIYPQPGAVPGYPAPVAGAHYVHYPGYGHYPAPGYPGLAPHLAPPTSHLPPGHYGFPPPSGPPGPPPAGHYDRERERDRDRSPVREREGRGRYSDEREYRDRRRDRGRRDRSRERDREERHRRRRSSGERERRHREERERHDHRRRERDRERQSRTEQRPAPVCGPAPLVPYDNDSEDEAGAQKSGEDDRSRRSQSRPEGRERDAKSSSPGGSQEQDVTKMTPEEIIEQEKKVWIRSAPADLYYQRDRDNPNVMKATEKNINLLSRFQEKLITASIEEKKKNPIEAPPRPPPHSHSHDHDDDSDSDAEEADHAHNHKVESMEWMNMRSKAANRAHPEIWFNVEGELNDGPACRCSKGAKETGIRHGIYVGETEMPDLEPNTNNFDKLYHYRVTISPPTNFLIKHPTIIHHDHHEFIFEGFSMFTVDKIPEVPVCKVVRFNIEYNILYFEEKMPENFTLAELSAFHQYFFHELLELFDWSVDQRFYFMPRFVRDLSENGKEILSMNEVISYMLNSYTPLIEEMDLMPMTQMAQSEWQTIADKVKGMLVTFPGKKPSTLRVDQLDREQEGAGSGCIKYPDIVHFGIKPPQLSYAGCQDYQKAWREFVKFRHLLANMAKPTYKDRRDLEAKEHALQEMRSNSKLKRDCTAVISAQGYVKTGLMTDIVQHALLLPVLVNHLRLHNSLDHLETRISFKFTHRYLLQQAVTHPSYKENFGTNPDHIRNTLSNCGIRQPEYGDKKIHYQNSRKRGINMLISIMSKFGKKRETESKVQHNERLEFLGDAVVEFITSVHLFYMFPDLEEGGLATYRAAMVQNQHLAILARGLGLDKYMLYAHGSDLCHDSELKHAMANCFEALMGAIFLDGGINLADTVFAEAMFGSENDLWETWKDLSPHPLQTQEPGGDRHWIETYPVLKKMEEFEKVTGIEFNHIRLLARAFTDRSIGFNNLTLGSNQRMEFLGDTVLQLITSEFLYKHFPDHHEGHLSLLRSSLVNNRTQSVVCDDLGMIKYALYNTPKAEIKIKDKADLLEAFLGALYVDKDLTYCQVFANVCFFPRLQQFILNQDWNDPKSKLQQCCLTLRTMDGGEPDIPIYKIIECKGPTNTRVYTVAVYFRGGRLAKAQGHSIQQAEMNAAKLALETCSHLFPHLNYQKRIMERSFKRQGVVTETIRETWYKETLRKRKELGLDVSDEEAEVKNEIKEESPDMEFETGETIIKEPVADSFENPQPSTSSSVQPDIVQDENLPSTPSVTTLNTMQPVEEVGQTSKVEDGNSKGEKSKSVENDVLTKQSKESVRAEIREIEEKLKRVKKKKVVAAKMAAGDLEDGECVDSEEDFETESTQEKSIAEIPKYVLPSEPEPAPPAPPPQQLPPAPPPEDKPKTREERREDNRRRWNEGKRSSSHREAERPRDHEARRSREGDRYGERERYGGDRHGRSEAHRHRDAGYRYEKERSKGSSRRDGYYDNYDGRQYRH